MLGPLVKPLRLARFGCAIAAVQGSSSPDVFVAPCLSPLDVASVPWWQLDPLRRVHPCLQFAASFEFSVEFGPEEQREIGQPEPEAEAP